MTKRVKSFISLFLAFLMIVGISTVNAFSAYEPIEREDTYYEYAGEFGLGRQTVKEVEWGDEISNYSVYYSFIAEHDGYYSFTYNKMHNSTWYGIFSEQNYDAELSYTYSPDSTEQNLSKIFYLEAGEYFFFADVYWSIVDVNIFAEYLGEKVSEIKFKHDLLMDCDCFYYSYSDSETNILIDATATIIFDSGKTFDFGNKEICDGYHQSDSLKAVIASEPIEGENRITVFFLNQQIETTVTIHTLSYYVNDVDVSNIDYYLENAVEYYNYFDIEYPYGETVTVTFNNGTSDDFVFSTYANNNFVTFPNGQKYSVNFWCFDTYDFADFNGYMQVDICYNTIKEFKINSPKASFSENIRVLNEDNKCLMGNILYCWECAKSSWNNTEELSVYLSDAIFYFTDILYNMSDFLGYYFTFSFLK
ncbi:MAG: hypothetical protein ACI4I3_06195 [Acutalibacteraceae bacterium]